MVYFGGFFAKQGYFAGFSLCIIIFSVRISEAAMGGAGTLYIITSVADPDPNPDPPDPHVFGPPGSGSGSTSQRYGSGSCSGSGSGSFYHHAKIERKTLIPNNL